LPYLADPGSPTFSILAELVLPFVSKHKSQVRNEKTSINKYVKEKTMSYNNRRHGDKLPIVSAWSTEPPKEGYIESAEQSRTAEQNKISKLTVKLQIISTKHDCRM